MHYDLTLKGLFHGRPERLLQLLTGQRVVETLNIEFPAVRNRQPDLVLRLDDGRIYHLELQSDYDVGMPWRMLEYYTLIARHYQASVLQQVLFVGSAPNRLADQIAQDRVNYSYQVVDIRDIDCRPLVESPSLADNLLALLCRVHDEAEVIRTVLGKIAALEENDRRDALLRLEILSGLRPLKALIQREVHKMPITLNLKDNPFFQEAFAEGEEKGRKEGRKEGRNEGVQAGEKRVLLRQLELRFGAIPPAYEARIVAANEDTVLLWSERLLSAEQLADVFAD